MWKVSTYLLATLLLFFAPVWLVVGSDDPIIDPVLVTINDQTISKLDFEISVHRLTDSVDSNQAEANTDYNQVLSAYINYRLLVNTAKRNIDADGVFNSEFENYFSIQTNSDNFLDRIEQETLREAYIRSHYMIDASHILLAVDKDIDAEQKTLTLSKVVKLKSALDQGKNEFGQVAVIYSDDPYSKNEFGKLAIFTVFEQLYPIESAAYETASGSISAPTESRFGYHLVKTNRKVRVNGQKDVSHILIKSPNYNDQYSKEKIFKIYSRLNNDNFAEIAKRHSEDYESAEKGGSLGTDRLLDRLEWKKIELPVGQFSKPLRTELGWHILKVNKLVPFMSYWQQESKLKDMIQLDSRIDRVIKTEQSINKNTVWQKVKQSYRDFFFTMKLLQKNNSIFDEKNSTELKMIKNILDKKLDINFSMLKQKNSVKINPKVLEVLFD